MLRKTKKALAREGSLALLFLKKTALRPICRLDDDCDDGNDDNGDNIDDDEDDDDDDDDDDDEDVYDE